jgi:hypothetical protein
VGSLSVQEIQRCGSLLPGGDRTFVSPQHFVTGGLSRSLYVADLNRDGKSDVVTADNLRNELSVLLHR